MQPRLLSFLIVFAAVAGCFGDDESSAAARKDFPYYDAADSNYHFEFDHADTRIHFDWAPGALGKLKNLGEVASVVSLPFGFVAVSGPEEGRTFGALLDSFEFEAGGTLWFLAPPGASTVDLVLDGESYFLDPAVTNDFQVNREQVVSGESVWDLSAYQEANFPHREPGHPDGNYAGAIAYFAAYFEELGMEVEVDPYGSQAATDVTGCLPTPAVTLCPESVANVVATLPGADPSLPAIFVAGGHFDMVPRTSHAAFDDTSGTVSTLELARAMSQFTWNHTLKFGLWGGEEGGLLGSQFWVQTHPEARGTVTSYWNLDVVGMSWPAPIVDPDPIVIAAGPDAPADDQGGAAGPMTDSLLAVALDLQQNWFAFPDEVDGAQMFFYEGVASGQANGEAGVNAQSDHTPFAAAGIPSWFIFNAHALASDNPVRIHSEKDTLDNMTKYALLGGDEARILMEVEEETGFPTIWDPAELALAKQILAESWETIMWFPFYTTLLQDIGYWHAPGAAGTAESTTRI